MSGKGNCYDNAVVESFFKTLKSELVWRPVFQSRAEAKDAIGRSIDGFCGQVYDVAASLRPMTPSTIAATLANFRSVMLSPNRTQPKRTVPSAPAPTQTG